MKKYYFCSWRNGSDKEFGAIFSEETENTLEVRKSRGIQSWINIHGPFSSEKEAEIAKFKSELRGLLERYNASIECEVHGDTHGLSYKMVVSFCREDRWRDYKLSDSNYISFQSIDWNDM